MSLKFTFLPNQHLFLNVFVKYPVPIYDPLSYSGEELIQQEAIVTDKVKDAEDICVNLEEGELVEENNEVS